MSINTKTIDYHIYGATIYKREFSYIYIYTYKLINVGLFNICFKTENLTVLAKT